MLWIGIVFDVSPDPDTTFHFDADPDPDQAQLCRSDRIRILTSAHHFVKIYKLLFN